MNTLNEIKKELKQEILSDLKNEQNLQDEELYGRIDELLLSRNDLSLRGAVVVSRRPSSTRSNLLSSFFFVILNIVFLPFLFYIFYFNTMVRST